MSATEEVDKPKNWHQEHKDSRTLGQKASDGVAKWMGSWAYIIVVVVFIIIYIAGNVWAWFTFDKYPFILLNLVLGIFVLFGAPLIMMSQNRQEDRDRLEAEHDYSNDKKALEILEKLDILIASMETDKLDRIIAAVEKKPAGNKVEEK